MPISAVSNTPVTNRTASAEVGGELGKNQFLELLVTQLQNQDPLDPMDSTEYISQLAQFSSLEQLQNINSQLESLNKTISDADDQSDGASLIGTEVEAVDTLVTVEGGVADGIHFELPSDIAAAYVSITDSDGNHVRTLQTGSLSKGEQTIAWNGTDDDGEKVPDGRYTFDIQAMDGDGDKVEATCEVTGTVTGATFADHTTYLLMGDNEVTMDSVTRITQGS